MRLQYIGHSCFYIVTDNGTRIVIDPYDDTIGLTPVDLTADILLITHHHHDHDYTDGVSGEYLLIDAPGEYASGGVRIKGIELDHDDAGGTKRGKVTAYLIEADGLRILHMGDVGAVPGKDFFEQLSGPIDVLMVPVGGTYTVDAQGAYDLTELVDANITIPMHFRTARLKLDIAPVTGYVDLVKKGYDIQRQGDVFVLDSSDPKKRGRVLLMENSY